MSTEPRKELVDGIEDALRAELGDALDPEELRQAACFSALYLVAVKSADPEVVIRAKRDMNTYLALARAQKEIQLERTVWCIVGILERFAIRALEAL